MGDSIVVVGRFDSPEQGVALPFGRKKLDLPMGGGRSVKFVQGSFAFKDFYVSASIGVRVDQPLVFTFRD